MISEPKMDIIDMNDKIGNICYQNFDKEILHIITKPICQVFKPDILTSKQPITYSTFSQKTILYKHTNDVLYVYHSIEAIHIDINKLLGIIVLGQGTKCDTVIDRELYEDEQIILDKICELCEELNIPKITSNVFVKLYELSRDNWQQFDLTFGRREQINKMLKLNRSEEREDIVNLIKYEFKLNIEDLNDEMVKSFIEDLKNCKPTVYGYLYYVEPVLDCDVFSCLVNILINYEQPIPKISNYATLNAYSDEEIEAGNFRKTSPYNWNGQGWSSKINTELNKRGTKITIEAVSVQDNRLSVKIKGPAAYFILYDEGVAKYSVIYNFGIDPISLYKIENA